MTSQTAAGTYRIAANVYSYNNEMTCDLADGDVCRFRGARPFHSMARVLPSPQIGEEVFSGLLARAVMPASKAASEAAQAYSPSTAHSWWLAGK